MESQAPSGLESPPQVECLLTNVCHPNAASFWLVRDDTLGGICYIPLTGRLRFCEFLKMGFKSERDFAGCDAAKIHRWHYPQVSLQSPATPRASAVGDPTRTRTWASLPAFWRLLWPRPQRALGALFCTSPTRHQPRKSLPHSDVHGSGYVQISICVTKVLIRHALDNCATKES